MNIRIVLGDGKVVKAVGKALLWQQVLLSLKLGGFGISKSVLWGRMDHSVEVHVA